jgi:hypothetical protein
VRGEVGTGMFAPVRVRGSPRAIRAKAEACAAEGLPPLCSSVTLCLLAVDRAASVSSGSDSFLSSSLSLLVGY